MFRERASGHVRQRTRKPHQSAFEQVFHQTFLSPKPRGIKVEHRSEVKGPLSLTHGRGCFSVQGRNPYDTLLDHSPQICPTSSLHTEPTNHALQLFSLPSPPHSLFMHGNHCQEFCCSCPSLSSLVLVLSQVAAARFLVSFHSTPTEMSCPRPESSPPRPLS